MHIHRCNPYYFATFIRINMKSLLFICLVSYAYAARFQTLQWKDCGSDPNRPIKFNSVTVNPTPVKIPGDLIANFDVDVTKDLTGQSELRVTIMKHRRFLKPFKVPCLLDWGSCTYDPCKLVEPWKTAGCPAELSAHGIPCTCPYPASKVVMTNQKFVIPKLPWFLDWLAGGDYEVTGLLVEKQSAEELGCIELKFSIE